MIDQPARAHDAFEELVAGQALYALEPDDEHRLIDHFAACPECRASLDDYTLVAAQLGALAYVESAEAPTWERIRPMGRLQPREGVVELHPRPATRHAASRVLAAAAAVVVLVALSVLGWALSHHTLRRPGTVVALASCEQQPGCRVIRLHSPDGANPAAVVVRRDRVTLVPMSMSSAPAGTTYALWQLPRDGGPILITEFRDAARRTASAPLASGYADTAAFAVSIESVSATPAQPTHVLAVGTAT